jgi:hypothetical protein
MASFSDQDVRVNGTSIMTTQFWIQNRGGLWGTPGFRSTNYDIAYLQGTMWRPKQIAETVRTLLIAVDATDANGVIPTSGALRRAQLNQNLMTLLALFAREDAQVTIERDVLVPDGIGGTTLETWTGYAQASSPILPESPEDFDDHMTLSVDLLFADPIWYGDAVQHTVTGTGTYTNPGNVQATNMTLTFSGGSNYRLTNQTYDPDAWVQIDYSGTIVLDTRAGTAFAGATNVIGYLSKAGTREFMRLAPGANTLVLTGGGQVVIDYNIPRS